MKLVVWKQDPRDPESMFGLHDLECDEATPVGGVIVVKKGGRVTHWIKTWDFAELDPERAPTGDDDATGEEGR